MEPLSEGHALLELLDVGVIVYGANATVAYANSAACTLLRITSAELISSSPERAWDITDIDGRAVDPEDEPFKRVLRTGEPVRDAILGVLLADESKRSWLRVNAMPLRNAGGVIERVLVSFTDVSVEVRKADEARQAKAASEQRYGAVLRAMHEGVAVHDTTGAITFCNPAAERILGLTRDQLLGIEGADPRWALVDADGAALPPERVPSEITRTTGHACRDVQLGIHRANGERAWLSVSTDPIACPGDASQGVVATFTDITAQRDALVALERANARFSTVTSLMPGVIYQFLARDDGTSEFPFVAGKTRELIGMREEDILADASAAWNAVHPEDVGAVRAATLTATETLTTFEAEMRFHNGKEWRWVRARATPARVADGVLFTAVALDITEERRLVEGLRKGSRHEVMADLAAGVAHNFNNMLAAVLPNLEEVREECPSSAAPALDDAIDATRRATDLVRQLLYVARGDYDGQPEPIELHTIVDEVTRLCRRSFDPGIALHVDVPPGLKATTFGRASQVHQVVLNLCLNARDALQGRDDRQLYIGLKEETGPVPGRAEGDCHFVLTIRDTGAGMDDTTLRRLGEPFFTTKPPGRGTGLGIASAMTTVREMAGHLEVSSTLGVGTTFRIHVPCIVERPAASPRAIAVRNDTLERVLLVEDEKLVRRAVERMLARFCRTTVSATDGVEALELLEARAGTFDVVLLDLAMPGASGREVLHRIHERWPDVPVVIMSGDTSDRAGLEHAADILDKPISSPLLQASLLRAAKRT